MSDSSHVFICPSCQAVVKYEGSIENGVTCHSCDHVFVEKAKETPVKVSAVKPLPRQGKVVSSGSVVRNLKTKSTAPLAGSAGAKKVNLSEEPSVNPVKKAIPARKPEQSEQVGRQKVRHRKKKEKKENYKSLLIFLAGWCGVTLTVFGFYKLKNEKPIEEVDPTTVEDVSSDEIKREILKKHLKVVLVNFKNFLNYSKDDGREQFIDRSAELAHPFARHYNFETFPTFTQESKLGLKASNVIILDEENYGVEVVLGDESGNNLGGVYLWDGEGWKLDWEGFAPYSDEPWFTFRSNLGKKRGVFRLLVRKRLTSDEENHIYLSCYRPPKFAESPEVFVNTASPEIKLLTRSYLGRDFLKMWTSFTDGGVPYDSILGKAMDPDGYMRLTVDLAWEKNEKGEEEMVLKEILGVSWHGQTIQEIAKKAAGTSYDPRPEVEN